MAIKNSHNPTKINQLIILIYFSKISDNLYQISVHRELVIRSGL